MMLLVFGRNGQVAAELGRQGGVVALGRDAADLAAPEACAAAIRAHRPRAVINAAAWTAVDPAETQEPRVTTINGAAPAAMARACAALDIPFVHLSTDYVFAGSGTRPWRPDDRPAPLNAYGRSKLAGEIGVRAAGGRFAILRTSWVFSAHGSNFVKTVLRLSQERDRLDIVADQIGGPTPARAIARACRVIARRLAEDPARAGIYHFSGAPDVSWHDFAAAILARTGRRTALSPVPTDARPAAARRPLNSRLDCTATERIFALPRPDWRAALDEVLLELEIIP